MVDIKSWTIPCKSCGMNYNIPHKSKITILSMEILELEKKTKCPLCGKSNSIAVLKKEYTGYYNLPPNP